MPRRLHLTGPLPDGLPGPEELRGRLSKHGVALGDEGDPESLPCSLELTDVPEADGKEAYRLRLDREGISLRARERTGFLRGLATLEQLLIGLAAEGEAPGLTVTDWPAMRYRGVFIEDKWGPDLMDLGDWESLVDYLASLKMNVLGIGLYGCWNVQYDGQVTEFLMVPVPGHPELRTPRSIRWYSAAARRWQRIDYLPRLFEEDFLADVVRYGARRGVEVVPFVNSLGHNTLFPRLLPAVSARDADGRPTGYGYCLSSEETWSFVSSFYASIIDRYLAPGGVRTFHIQMDEIYPVLGADPRDPLSRVDPDCRCARCSNVPTETRIRDYVVRLAAFLRDRGMENVVIWNDQLTRHMDLIDDSFVGRLETEGLRDTLVVHWWWYDNLSISEKVHPKLGRGLRAWMGPMSCYYNWAYFRVNRPNIPRMLELGHREGAEGGVSYSVFDPANDVDYRLMAAGTWDHPGDDRGGWQDEVRRWARVTAGGEAEEGALMEALTCLDRAASAPEVRRLAYYTYTYPAEGRPYPRRYPLEALEALEETQPNDSLEDMAKNAARSREILRRLRSASTPDSPAARTLGALHGEAVRLDLLAGAFLSMLEMRRNPSGASSAAAALRSRIEADMRLIEESKPDYLRPSVLRDLSVLYEFAGRLASDLDEVESGGRSAESIRWFVEPDAAQEGRT